MFKSLIANDRTYYFMKTIKGTAAYVKHFFDVIALVK